MFPTGPDKCAAPRAPIRGRLTAVSVAALTGLLDLYQALIARFLAVQSGCGCRFEPSCSRYAKTALARHGVARGCYLTIRRLARCNPLGGYGYDPVPQPPPHRAGS